MKVIQKMTEIKINWWNLSQWKDHFMAINGLSCQSKYTKQIWISLFDPASFIRWYTPLDMKKSRTIGILSEGQGNKLYLQKAEEVGDCAKLWFFNHKQKHVWI